MKTLKAKIVRSKPAESKKGKITVTVARMERVMTLSRDTLRERASVVRGDDGRFMGALTGPTGAVRRK
jgi:hypothetical protein